MPDTQNYEELINKLIQSAENGDAKSQYHLGVLYHDGKSVDQNYVQAAYWYRKAAEQGHNKAQLYLGLLYSKGYGVPRNYDEAVKWLTLSSENGNDKANDFLEDILNAQEADNNEDTNSHSRIFTLMASAVIILSVIVIASALLFMDRTNDMIAYMPVKTLPNNDDDILSPPVNSAYNPYIFPLTESGARDKTSDSNIDSLSVRDKASEKSVNAGRQQAEKLLKAKRISPFVKDTGTFEYNPDYEDENVEIAGSNVRMRKQPNTKSRIVKTVNRISENESLKYLGEWTSPQGDKWVVCAYKENPKVRDVDAKIVWIFGKYIRLIRAPEKDLVLEGESFD
ncbi:MAG: SEL1-like repeat protein [Synergistaceae bacterium]|nr:SEL1-like repeat protein [Synergistaceae bacterium]